MLRSDNTADLDRRLSLDQMRERVELYVRTYRTILRSAGETRLRTLEAPHIEMASSLHAGAGDPRPDMGALIYAMQRLPACMPAVRHLTFGQSPDAIGRAIDADVSGWQSVTSPGRRRRWLWDGGDRLGVLVASESDVDDLIPTAVAYQIEWNKLHTLLRHAGVADHDPSQIWRDLDVREADWQHFAEITGDLTGFLQAVAAHEKDLRVRAVGGTHVGYARATRRWWSAIHNTLVAEGLDQRPIYFVSSNTHSLINLLSGVAARLEDEILAFVDASRDPELLTEREAIRTGASRASWTNFLYYAARAYFARHPDAERLRERRASEETTLGIRWVPPHGAIDVACQIIRLDGLEPGRLDSRLGTIDETGLRASDAVIVNIDYPLGLAAYRALREAAEDLEQLRGVYVLGKAATLNAAVGDVLVSDVILDEHTDNTYWFDNCFSAADVAPYLVFGSALDGQQAVTVLGTFLQNRGHLDFYYREAFTVVEMEGGPYLSAVYEAAYPMRHPAEQHVNLARLPFDLGILHYASDTPYTQARTLGARGLSYRGMDSTYAGAVAILRRIFEREGLLK
ncbi:MAG: hypothetical protein AB7R89_14175 [Dehalococcoidia bacterium]